MPADWREKMMTNIKIELTDEQRRLLQTQLTGLVRPISRAELTAFVSGVVTGAMDCEHVVETAKQPCFQPRADLSDMPYKWAETYADQPEHWKVGWLRGWNLIGGALAEGRLEAGK
jgi:hypothetical protein